MKEKVYRIIQGKAFFYIVIFWMAIAFWSYTEGWQKTDYTFQTKIQYRDVYPNLVPGEGSTRNAKLTISILKKDVEGFDEKDGRFTVSLTRYKRPGTYQVGLSPKNYHHEMSSGVKQISPSDAYVFLEKKYTKKVPVVLNKTRELREDLRIKNTIIRPAVITLEGPASSIKKIKKIQTAPLDVSALTYPKKYQKILSLKSPSPWIRMNEKQVKLTLEVDDRLIFKTFKDVPVRVFSHDPHKRFRIDPERISVQIEGGKSQMDITSAKDIYVSIDLSRNESGFYPLGIKLPEGISLRKVTPDKVYVQLRGK